MSSRPHKHFPPGTFIPTPQRLMAIAQLCIAFSLLIWYMVQPFMGEYFNLRSRMLIYEYAFGTSDLLKKAGEEEKLMRQAERFSLLSDNQKQVLLKDYQQLQEYGNRPTYQKILDGLRTLMLDIPPFEQAWIFFSITIAILILLKVEGAKSAAWLLPLIVLVYSVDNQLYGKSYFSPDLPLFPTEENIVQNYLHEPLSSSLLEQQLQLKKGWNNYLIDQWTIHHDVNNTHQLEEAEFQFTLARLGLFHNQPRSEWLNVFHEKLHSFWLLLFIGWNVLFAWIVSRPLEAFLKLGNACFKMKF